jgi:cellulose synthase/poly-beta-1,6-N-acetylglucosamine synthase-like glycosyltransferase
VNGGFTYCLLRVAEVLFWGSIGTVLYSYFVYPLIVAVIVRIAGARPVAADDGYLPVVSVMISLYNEEAVLPEKLRNLEATQYPQEKLRIIFGSDGSTDSTNRILAGWSHPGKTVIEFSERRGKGPVLNDLVRAVDSEVIVFSDANTMYEPLTIGRLVRSLADPAVGAVCGELVLLPEGSDAGGVGEVSYWSYENWLKRMESDLHTLLGATGGVYAIRRALFVPLPDHKSVTDDFLIPLKIVMKGYRVIYSRDALAYERTSGSMKGEFRRKARIGAQNFAGIAEFASLLRPRAGFTAFALWSHKIIRWSVPFLAIIAFGATALLAPGSAFYAIVFALEIAFLVLAAAGFIADRSHVRLGSAGLPYYIVAMNTALLVGFFRYMLNRQRTTWEVLR